MYDSKPSDRREFLNRALEVSALGLLSSPLATLSATAAPKGVVPQSGWKIGCYTAPGTSTITGWHSTPLLKPGSNSLA